MSYIQTNAYRKPGSISRAFPSFPKLEIMENGHLIVLAERTDAYEVQKAFASCRTYAWRAIHALTC